MSVVNSFNNWSPLEEVWLGDVYPASWYDHLESEVRDCFYELTQRTQEDLAVIQRTLENLGVTVCRPTYSCIDDYISEYDNQLIKPEICPRDEYLTVGQTLFAKKYNNAPNPWQQHIDRYQAQGANIQHLLISDRMCLNGANAVRAGQDIYFDLVWSADVGGHDSDNLDLLVQHYQEHFATHFKDFRVHILFNGGHVDACFSLLKPGAILGSRYYTDYEKTFPGWHLINVAEPAFAEHLRPWSSPAHNGKWYIPEMEPSRSFNKHIIEHAKTWVGNYTETFFEVNCLVIDEKNVVIPGENPAVFEALQKLGITAHPVPFRTRTFWDGGMHCITVDIRRRGGLTDHFADRGPAGLTVYK
jgi:hypothetical protein